MHITAIASYGGGERWRWSEGGRERKRQERSCHVTMAAHFLFFFSPAKSASEKCVFFFNGVGCKADMAVLSELLVHFAALRIPFCVSVEIREQTITVISSQ